MTCLICGCSPTNIWHSLPYGTLYKAGDKVRSTHGFVGMTV